LQQNPSRIDGDTEERRGEKFSSDSLFFGSTVRNLLCINYGITGRETRRQRNPRAAQQAHKVWRKQSTERLRYTGKSTQQVGASAAVLFEAIFRPLCATTIGWIKLKLHRARVPILYRPTPNFHIHCYLSSTQR
jgi:hypothetical protein